jgi:uncharacterized protein YkwD
MRASIFAFALSLPTFLIACGSSSDTSGSGAGAPQYTPFALPANAYSHGDPTPKEQALVELIQATRSDPAKMGQEIVELPSVQQAMVQFKVDKAQVVKDFMGYKSVPPLAIDSHLLESSRFHSNDMSTKEFQQHNGSAGESFDQRITKAGYKWSGVAENIFASAKDVEECNAAFLIDWGNPDLGHRKNLLDLENGRSRDIGVGIVLNTTSSKVGPLIVTEDFGFPASDAHRLLVGVAYKDTNANGRYDEGEGVADMKIVPNKGDSYAVTSVSGGYAIPVTQKSGAFKVQIQDASGVALDEKDTELDADNVKLDFVLAP